MSRMAHICPEWQEIKINRVESWMSRMASSNGILEWHPRMASAVTLVLVPTVVLIVNDIRQYLGDLTGSVNDTSTAQVNSEHSQEF
jgi:hypothetical protein